MPQTATVDAAVERVMHEDKETVLAVPTDWTAEKATRRLRYIHAALAENISSEACREMITNPGKVPAATPDDDVDVPEHLAQIILWAAQAHAGGYKPEDCEVVYVPKPDGACSPALTCKL